MMPHQIITEKEIPEAWRAEWTLAVAKPIVDTEKESNIYLFIFLVGSEWCGVHPSCIEAIVPRLKVHCLPGRGRPVSGLVNFRGKILPCIDLSQLLKTAAQADDRMLYTVIFNFHNWLLAFNAAEIEGIHPFASNDVLPLPSTIDQETVHHACGLFDWKGKSIIWLEADSLEKNLRQEIK